MQNARWAVVAVLALSGCRELRTIEADGRCGNAILEPEVGEDCDLHGVPPGSRCGSPGTAEACHYLCGGVGDEAAVCPAGWGCGRDGVCRAPSGALDVRRVVPVDGPHLASGDVDNDGLDDVIAFASDHLSIAFGDPDGRFDSRTEVPITAPEPHAVVANVDAEAAEDPDAVAADVIVPQVGGAQIFRGGGDRRLKPVAIPSLAVGDLGPFGRVIPARAESPYVRHDVLLAASDGAGTTFRVAGRERTDATEADALFRGRELGVRASVASGDLDGGGSPDEVALAAGDRIAVLSVRCDVAPGDCVVEVRDVLDTPPQTTATGSTWFADFEGDGDLDLIAPLRMGEAFAVGVAVVDEEGKLGALTLQEHLAVAVGCMQAQTACRSPVDSPLLAVGDVDGDGVADFVKTGGVYVAGDGTPPKMTERFRATRPWNAAAIGDFNHDGTPDVAATRPGTVDLLLTAPDGLFNPLYAEIEDEARTLRTGDFDGDLVTDLAVVEAPGRLVVLFRGAQGTPTERIVMADLPEIGGLEPLRSEANDRIDDLVMLTRTPEGSLVTAMVGTSSRRMLAPIPRFGRVFATAAVGRFLGGARPDIVTGEVTNVDGARFVDFRLTKGDDLERSPAVSTQLARDAECVLPRDFAGSSAVADLDGDGHDELVFLESASPDESAGIGANGWKSWILRFEEGALRCIEPGVVRSSMSPGKVRLADLDGDGALDAFAPLDISRRRGPTAPTAGRPTLAFWKGLKQAPWLDAPVVFTLQEDEVPRFDVAAAELDGTPGAELFGLSDAGRIRIDIEKGGARVRADGHEAAPRDVIGLHTMDTDGDGLDDLVATTGSELYTWRQKPCPAAQVHAGTCVRREPEAAER